MDKEYFLLNFDRALSEGWIKAYNQPLIRTANGRVCDEEAFARWTDPESGETFEAVEFVPYLEEAGIVHKLDLYIVEQVINKLETQKKNGLFLVPESINLSGKDFYACDIVEEIKKRIDASDISPDLISVELSEKVISGDVDFMKEHIERFQKLGIKVWMDNYGSGYASLLILLNIKVDLLKIDEIFISNIEKSEDVRIILTELLKTALAMGIDTVAEGVETREQVRFLKEIGCTKLQGYYYLKPLSLESILERYNKGLQIGFENPAETEYYEKLGRVNLYDFSMSRSDNTTLNRYFDTMPMVIYEIGQERASFVRCNKSYREFVAEYFPDEVGNHHIDFKEFQSKSGSYSFKCARQCAEDGRRMIVDDRNGDGTSFQLFIRRLAVNPVTNMAAVAIVVLYVADSLVDAGLTYNYVARALSEDYIDLFFIDLDKDEFIEYASDGANRDISVERNGKGFFELALNGVENIIYEGDRKLFYSSFSKEKIVQDMEKHGIYSLTYRQMIGGTPVYVNMKAVKIRNNANQIIIGISNVDAQMKQRETFERVKEERIIYSRIGALTGDFIYIFTVDIKTDHYDKYNPLGIKSGLEIDDEGEDFFATVIDRAHKGIHPDDVDQFITAFAKANMLGQIEKSGLFLNDHRLMVEGKTIYVRMKATLVEESGEQKLIVGIINMDAQVKREQEYVRNLAAAQTLANFDELTGVRNKHAYAALRSDLNEHIAEGEKPEFAIGVFDLNGLKQINDTLGHRAGDRFIKKGCDIICNVFKRSAVFRVGGDEFVVVAQGEDYNNLDILMEEIYRINLTNRGKGEVVIAAGMSRYDNDYNVSQVFERADEEMYKNKKLLKGVV